MTNRFTRKLSYGKKILLASAVIVAIAGPVVVGLLYPPPGRAQSKAGQVAPAFEVASVKTFDGPLYPGALQMKGGPGSSDPGRVTWGAVDLLSLLMKAFDVGGYRIVGLASSKGRDIKLFTITATMPPETTRQQFQLMLQNLLVERFKLQFHHETRSFPGYELVVAPGGPRLREPADPDAPEPDRGPTGEHGDDGFPVLPKGHGKGVRMSSGGFYAKFQDCTITELIEPYLRSFIQQSTGAETNAIVDKTGLTGKYDFTLKFDSRGGATIVGPEGTILRPESDEDSGLPDIFRALEKQLGLKLVKVNGVALDTIVIDHVEKQPTAN
jgi:uncharacterized protein (TIGR03435 family)